MQTHLNKVLLLVSLIAMLFCWDKAGGYSQQVLRLIISSDVFAWTTAVIREVLKDPGATESGSQVNKYPRGARFPHQ